VLSIPLKFLLGFIVLISLYLFFSAFILRIRLVLKGRRDSIKRSAGRRLPYALFETFSEKHVLRTRFFPGFFHALIFWGFVLFLFSTVSMLLEGFFNVELLGEGKVSVSIRFLTDIFALFVSVGVVGLALRRFILKPEALHLPNPDNGVILKSKVKSHPQFKSAIVLFLIFFLMITYIYVEASRMTLEGNYHSYEPLSNIVAYFLNPLDKGTLSITFNVAWLLHIVSVFIFLILIPRSKHLHIVTGFINLLLKRYEPSGVLESMELEEAENFGALKVEEIPRKNLFDTISCIECGRCQDECPAYQSGVSLSPKWVIVNLREHLLEEAENLLKGGESEKQLMGEILDDEALWACTTCGACMNICPMGIEHIPILMEIRRAQVLMEGNFPKELTQAIKGLETQGNPWGIFGGDRADWAKGLDVKRIQENTEVEYLLFVGCAASFDERAKKVARAVVEVLNKAEISFGILGEEEKCTGDPARRIGNEYLFQLLAQDNIETFKRYGIKKIITICPHCYNTLKNEYPQLGGYYEVYSHSVFLLNLIESGRIEIKRRVDDKLTYHDPCYLGRHNDIYKEPRKIMKSISNFIEMGRSKSRSFCCGAGGGRMWMEAGRGERINRMRIKEAKGTGADVIVTSCPFCMRMLDDGIKELELEEKIEVKDISELILESIA
jgi:Fe-S oxidoreductase